MDSKWRKWRWCLALYLMIAAAHTGSMYFAMNFTLGAAIANGLVSPAYHVATMFNQDSDSLSRAFPPRIFWQYRGEPNFYWTKR